MYSLAPRANPGWRMWPRGLGLGYRKNGTAITKVDKAVGKAYLERDVPSSVWTCNEASKWRCQALCWADRSERVADWRYTLESSAQMLYCPHSRCTRVITVLRALRSKGPPPPKVEWKEICTLMRCCPWPRSLLVFGPCGWHRCLAHCSPLWRTWSPL